ncbi:MAG: DUF3800 domain-containing protein [Panacagrimonas sp.]
MFFHIDESGNTGNNLFDAAQPRLSYGVLSSLTNVDVLGEPLMLEIRKRIGQERIHASQLNVAGLTPIVPLLAAIQRKMRFEFDYYFVVKLDYAVTTLFEAVFDQGLNPAVKWDLYWTPMRYTVIARLASILPVDVLQRSWELSRARKAQLKSSDIFALLTEVRALVLAAPFDERACELIVNALDWGIANPLQLDYGTDDANMISPNAIGYQFVSSAIARRVKKKNRRHPAAIVIDRQNQFNPAQLRTHQLLGAMTKGIVAMPGDEQRTFIKHPLHATLSRDEVMYRGIPDSWPVVSGSENSIGLQIVDVYLWLTNRVLTGANLSSELKAFWFMFGPNSMIDGISIDGMMQRFSKFEEILPKQENLTDEHKASHRQLVEKHRTKVRSLKLGGEA